MHVPLLHGVVTHHNTSTAAGEEVQESPTHPLVYIGVKGEGMYAMFVRLIGIEKRDLGDGNDGIARSGEANRRGMESCWQVVPANYQRKGSAMSSYRN
jgi:hypothetical protein